MPLTETELDVFANFKYNLQVLRAAASLSANELSVVLGFNIRRIGSLESATKHVPKVEEIIAIAKYFNTSTDNLIHKKVIVKFID